MKGFLIICFTTISLFVQAQVNLTKLGQLPYTERLSDIWGWTSSEGQEYALVGTVSGISIVDVSIPSSPSQVAFISGSSSNWRDIKTWNNHAYITNETSSGLMIIDLKPLPTSSSLPVKLYKGVNFLFQKAHNLYIDENGICYVFGANYNGGGAIMLDLNDDPENPKEVGVFSDFYLHDGVVRGDTLWGAAINEGVGLVIDVSVKNNPKIIGSWETPLHFTHNCWISDNGKFIYTTDERSGAFVTGYNVSDLSNITETDRIQSSPGMEVIPHNTHYINDYLITSYYTDGVTITDVSRPHNMIEVGNYDTSPNFSGSGYDGNWGAFPWLPSGNILVSDREEGLYILKPNYQRACYLEGIVKDDLCNAPIENVKVEIVGENIFKNTKSDGNFAIGVVNAGLYSISFSKSGYDTKKIDSVNLQNGIITNMNVKLVSNNTVNLTGLVLDQSNQPIDGTHILIENDTNFYSFITDSNGKFNKCNIIQGIYKTTTAKWQYKTICHTNVLIDNSTIILTEVLQKQYCDDFSFNFGWVVTGTTEKGKWTRAKPIGSGHNDKLANPDNDVDFDCSDKAFITGNYSDVDNGTTILTSPIMNLSANGNDYINYYRWFYTYPDNKDDILSSENYLSVKLSNGITVIELEKITDTLSANWTGKSFKLSEVISVTDSMQIIFEVGDMGIDSPVEAGIDAFSISKTPVSVTNLAHTNTYFNVYPNPFSDNLKIAYDIESLDKSELILVDLVGKLIDKIELRNEKSFINYNSSLKSGIYFILLKNNGQIMQTTKVIKIH